MQCAYLLASFSIHSAYSRRDGWAELTYWMVGYHKYRTELVYPPKNSYSSVFSIPMRPTQKLHIEINMLPISQTATRIKMKRLR